jgi:hypothetical protein
MSLIYVRFRIKKKFKLYEYLFNVTRLILLVQKHLYNF